MSRWLPFPLLAMVLLAMWLLLNDTVSPGAVILGGVLAVAASRTLVTFGVPKARLRRPRAAFRLAIIVLIEIIRSNNAVARIILRPGARDRTSGFVRIPLDMRDPYGLAVLACIITATPGTIWVEYDSTKSTVLLHVLDLIDEDDWVQIIKDRYEKRLMEIFE
jgi:multicomponent K+:H+ antiporter subunit E